MTKPNSSVKDLYQNVITGVRTAANEIPDFKNGRGGAIVAQIVSYCDDAATWAQDITTQDEDIYPDDRMPTQIWPILPGRNTIIATDDGPLNCAAFALMKLAHAKVNASSIAPNLSSGLEFHGSELYRTENGFAPYRGAAGIRIGRKTANPAPCIGMGYGAHLHEIYADIGVVVSGASDSKLDELCALAGLDAIEAWFKNQPGDNYVILQRHTLVT